MLHSKVFENYFSMTSLNVFNSLISLLLYPYLIRTLGKDSYGLYVFVFSIIGFFSIINQFGFNFPSTKKIVENINDTKRKGEILSSVFTAKILIFTVLSIIFAVLCCLAPIFRSNLLIFLLAYTTLIVDIIFPRWYFLATQKMRLATNIQLFFKILTIPFIFIFIKNSSDVWIYTLIYSVSMLLGGIGAMYILWRDECLLPKLVALKNTKKYFHDALPFFWASSAGSIQSESITFIIGTFFNFTEVAIYDLANKVINLSRILITNVNLALFPKVFAENSRTAVKKILRLEILSGISIVAFFGIFGYWIVLFLGGKTMIAAFPIMLILSTTILAMLLVSAYNNFIFTPAEKYYLITKNQIVSLILFYIFALTGILFSQTAITLAIAYSMANIIEIFYCKYLISKHKLL